MTLEILRMALSKADPPIPCQIIEEALKVVEDLGAVQDFQTTRQCDRYVELVQGWVRIDQWQEGEPVPWGWVECLPGPHIRKLDVGASIGAIYGDDMAGRGVRLCTRSTPVLNGDELVEWSIGDPRPIIVQGVRR